MDNSDIVTQEVMIDGKMETIVIKGPHEENEEQLNLDETLDLTGTLKEMGDQDESKATTN